MRKPCTVLCSSALPLAAVLLGGCASSTPNVNEGEHHEATEAASSIAIAGTASPIATVQPASETAVPASPFQAVAELPAPARLFALKGTVLVQADGYPKAREDQLGIPIGVVENDKLTFPDRLFFSTAFAQIVDVGGAWPDQVDMIATGTTGRTGVAEYWRLGKKEWENGKGTESFWFAGMAASGSSLLALQVPSMAWPGSRSDLVAVRGTLGGRRLTPVDKRACAKVLSAEEMATLQPNEVFATAFGGTGAGTLFALGFRCGAVAAAEMWPAGSSKSTVVNLPEGAGELAENTQMAKGLDDQVWLFGDKLIHYDGKVWSAVESPHLAFGGVGPDGVLWAVGDKGALYKGGVAGFSPVSVPSGAEVSGLAVTDDGTVWIAAGGALLRTKKPSDGAPGVKVAATAPSGRPSVKAPPKAGSKKCKTNVVVLYGFTKTTPADYDFPLSRKALKGHTELSKVRFVVTKDYGQKFFSALVSSFEEGKKLASVIEKEVKGARPQVVCAEPEVLRELKIDLKTGDVIQ